MNIHDKSKKEWYDAFTAMAKENALLAAKVRIGERGRLENLQETVKDQQVLIDILTGEMCPSDMGWKDCNDCNDCDPVVADEKCRECWRKAVPK